MVKALIVDNEKDSREVLQWQLDKYCPTVKVIASMESSTEAIAMIKKLAPRLLFLDIQMPEINGFELLEKLNPVNFDVIFTTGYKEFAVKAFKYNALDYLLKPIGGDELRAAVTRVELKIAASNVRPATHIHGVTQRLALSIQDTFLFIDPENILYCEGKNHYTYFHLNTVEKKILVPRPIEEIKELLVPYGFYRIHNSFLVNMKYAKEYVRGPGGYIIMENGDHLTVSKSRKEEFFESFLRF